MHQGLERAGIQRVIYGGWGGGWERRVARSHDRCLDDNKILAKIKHIKLSYHISKVKLQ